jgi:3-methyladenine DNA glycosylase AlkD
VFSDITVRLVSSFEAHRDAERAAAMSAYMRHQFPFVGIPTPQRRLLQRAAARNLSPPESSVLTDTVEALWAMPEREYQYAAVDLASRYVGLCGPDLIVTTRALITTKSWWDTVDALAGHVVGPLVLAHPQLISVMDEWIDAAEMWLVRTAILHQLTFKHRTDTGRLFDYCLRRGDHADFFIRKAIGWSLREYSKTDVKAVRAFVADNDGRLSPLSKREALLWSTGRRKREPTEFPRS